MSVETVILLGMGSEDLLVTLGYGITGAGPIPPPAPSVFRAWPITIGLGVENKLVTLGYGTGGAGPAPPPPAAGVTAPEHWGHWPFVRRKLTSTSTGVEEEVIEAFVEEVEQEIEQATEGVYVRAPDWNRILDEALASIQERLAQERVFDLPARKQERRRIAEIARLELIRLEDEEAAIAFLLME